MYVSAISSRKKEAEEEKGTKDLTNASESRKVNFSNCTLRTRKELYNNINKSSNREKKKKTSPLKNAQKINGVTFQMN